MLSAGPAHLDDRAERVAIEALLAEVSAATGHLPIDLLAPGAPDGAIAFAARKETLGAVVGFAQLRPSSDGFTLECVVSPRLGEESRTISREVVAHTLEALAVHGGGRVDWWIERPTPNDEELAKRLGFVPDRAILQMRRPLPLVAGPSEDPTRGSRTFRIGEDEAAFLVANNAAFAGHREQGAWDLETMAEHERQPWFDPDGFFLEFRDGVVAAFCWTKVHDLEPPIGEIYVIAVHPAFQGHGLGKLLVLRGLSYLSRRELREAMLYVASDNAAAIALYEALGFRTDHSDRAYTTTIASAR